MAVPLLSSMQGKHRCFIPATEEKQRRFSSCEQRFGLNARQGRFCSPFTEAQERKDLYNEEISCKVVFNLCPGPRLVPGFEHASLCRQYWLASGAAFCPSLPTCLKPCQAWTLRLPGPRFHDGGPAAKWQACIGSEVQRQRPGRKCSL